MKLSFLAFVFLLFSCKKDRSCDSCNTETGFKDATIFNGGPVETDGCDWLIKIGDEYYHPDVLDARFKQHDLKVKLCYEQTTDIYLCGVGAIPFPIIHVLTIKR